MQVLSIIGRRDGFCLFGVVKLAGRARRITLGMDDYSEACTYVRADLCMESLSEAWICISWICVQFERLDGYMWNVIWIKKKEGSSGAEWCEGELVEYVFLFARKVFYEWSWSVGEVYDLVGSVGSRKNCSTYVMIWSWFEWWGECLLNCVVWAWGDQEGGALWATANAVVSDVGSTLRTCGIRNNLEQS